MLPIDANEQDLMRAQILEKFTLVASAVYSGSLRYVKDVPESMTAANSTGADSLPMLIVVTSVCTAFSRFNVCSWGWKSVSVWPRLPVSPNCRS